MTGIGKGETKAMCEKTPLEKVMSEVGEIYDEPLQMDSPVPMTEETPTTYTTARITPKKGALLIFLGPGKLLGDRLKDAWVKIADNVWRRK